MPLNATARGGTRKEGRITREVFLAGYMPSDDEDEEALLKYPNSAINDLDDAVRFLRTNTNIWNEIE